MRSDAGVRSRGPVHPMPSEHASEIRDPSDRLARSLPLAGRVRHSANIPVVPSSDRVQHVATLRRRSTEAKSNIDFELFKDQRPRCSLSVRIFSRLDTIGCSNRTGSKATQCERGRCGAGTTEVHDAVLF